MPENNAFVYLNSLEFKKRLDEAKGDTGAVSNCVVRKHFVADVEPKAIGDVKERTRRFVISTEAVDRDRDTIAMDGWDLRQFRKNPVVLFAHNSRQPPIGRAKRLVKEDSKLKSDVQFMDSDIDTSGFSDMIFRMVDGGFLRATSVGFLPKEFERVEDDEGPRRFGVDFKKQELLEFSVVPVPSNPEALIEARSKGIDTHLLEEWFVKALDEWAEYKGMLLVPRKDFEAFYKTGFEKTNKVYHATPEEQAALAAKNLEAAKEHEKPNTIEEITAAGEDDGTQDHTDYECGLEGHKHDSQEAVDNCKAAAAAVAQLKEQLDAAKDFGAEQEELAAKYAKVLGIDPEELQNIDLTGVTVPEGFVDEIVALIRARIDAQGKGEEEEEEKEETPVHRVLGRFRMADGTIVEGELVEEEEETPKERGLKVLCDGTPDSARIVFADNGEEVPGVVSVTFRQLVGETPRVIVEINDAEIEVSVKDELVQLWAKKPEETEEPEAESEGVITLSDEDDETKETKPEEKDKDTGEEKFNVDTKEIAGLLAEVVQEIGQDLMSRKLGKID